MNIQSSTISVSVAKSLQRELRVPGHTLCLLELILSAAAEYWYAFGTCGDNRENHRDSPEASHSFEDLYCCELK